MHIVQKTNKMYTIHHFIYPFRLKRGMQTSMKCDKDMFFIPDAAEWMTI